ncbi:MAG: ACT domain-containing protein, partial [Paeniglutamicibacter terrestris]
RRRHRHRPGLLDQLPQLGQAVMGDTVAVARRVVSGGPLPAVAAQQPNTALSFEQITTSYAIGLRVSDESGVLAAIAAIFAANSVSIEALRQSGSDSVDGGSAMLRIVTHRSTESALAATVAAVASLDAVQEVTSVLRVEGN